MMLLEAIVLLTMVLAIAHAARQFVLSFRVGIRIAPDRAHGGTPDATPTEQGQPAQWPSVSILIPAHNEDRVIGGCMQAMLALEYPAEQLSIIVVNDRSTDGTRAVIDEHHARDPRIVPLHRPDSAKPGKAAALADAMARVQSEIVVLFDADYLPHPELLKQLVAPFADPRVGVTMGRVVPYNSDRNTLTRLLDIERRCGYAVDQHARAVMGLVPQFGGTVGGIRLSALAAVGGWKQGHLTEDTDLTFRMVLGGWDVAYLNAAMCYEEVPENWQVRFKQVRRWSYGHNECMLAYLWPVLRARHLRLGQKVDAALVLTCYFFPVLAMVSMFAAIPLLAYGTSHSLTQTAFQVLGPLLAVAVVASHFQAMVAAINDDQPHVVWKFPLIALSSAVSMVAAATGFFQLIRNRIVGRAMAWDKTQRFRMAIVPPKG